ncbi:MAG TPA: DEAD/DEAH box helicase, partial [Candidatus Didemnitutus sp.]|nr:DEAD/DEAH box helicase [Candidatus Didemnitutus sp.]
MLRLLLPPNLATAVERDAVAVRVALDLSGAPPAELLPGFAVLQRLGVPPQPTSLVQLKRAQLRELVTALAGQPVFFLASVPDVPLAWHGRELSGVSEHLGEKPAPERAPLRRPVTRVAPEPPARDAPLTPMLVDGSEHYLAIALPSRSSANYDAALEFLRFHRFTVDPLNRKWWLRDRHKVLNLLATHGAELRERFGAEFTDNFRRNTANLQTADISAEVTEASDGYDVTLGLKAGRASEAQVREAVATGRGYVEDGKNIYLVDAARLAKLEAAHRALAGDPAAAGGAARRHRVAKARAAEVTDLLEELAPHFQAPETWRARSTALHRLTTLPPAPMPVSLEQILRPYQKLGAAWLWHLYRQQLGGILADEMGLGKTLQALALLAAASASTRSSTPHLVVAPASLVENWRREAARFTPELRVFVHHGTRRLAAADFVAHDLVLTSYGTHTRDAALFESIEFDLILADEAQHLKNRRTQAAQSLRALRGRGRFLLTGTPLENSLDDLRSLFEFLMPGFLPKVPPGSKREERSWHDERLRAQTAPYILRRSKAAVAPELPEKIEQTIYCEPTPEQAALYRRMQEDSERELIDLAAKGASEGNLRLATLTQLLRLRQVCCDPRLVRSNKSVSEDDAAPNSAKLDAFRELLAESIDEGHRMLVFSQFTSLLALLREELDAQDVAYCYLDGSLTAKARQAEVDRFQRDDAVPVFLISLKAGGTGLNLTGADVVVHYDPWWNPAAEAQATDRAHRIGQT